jgi:endonuclease YncB( thermonuclease family)
MRSTHRRSSLTPRRLALIVIALGVSTTTSSRDSVAADAQTKVILNGKAVPVHFNDGDSFRVLAGEFKDARARLAGFNTLESYGPVHQWGGWHAKELYVLAKMGTNNGRDGVWECETDGNTDTYGRVLVWCPKLAEDQIRKGFAHAMSIDDNPARPELVAAQQDAIAAGRGIWAHGVPDFILTSLHSKEEDVDGKGTYNRLVSSADGHSVKWRHSNRYAECERVCHYVYTVNESILDALVAEAKADAQISKLLADSSDADLRSILHDFAKYRHANRKVPKPQREQLERLLGEWAKAGKFGAQQRSEASCMIHAPFERRFGGGRAECLK